MKRILASIFLLCSAALFGQSTLANITYIGLLNSTCAVSTACSGAVFAGAGGVPGLPQSNTGILGSGSALDVPVANYNAAVVTVSGTYAGSTITFELSDSLGTNYFAVVCARSDINLLESSETLPTNQARSFNCPVWASYRFRVRQTAYSSGNVVVNITLTQAAIDPSLVVAASIANVAGASDPCQDVSAIKQSAVVNMAAPATTQIVALSGTTNIYVCSYQVVASAGTAPTFQWQYGTGSNCGTGTTALTGTMGTGVTVAAGVPGPILESSGGNTLLKTAAGNALCATTAGTSANWQGWVSFVQQ